MTQTKTRELLDVFAALLAAAVLAACSSTNPTNHTGAGPSAPSGATTIPGGPLEPTPIAPSPKIPKSQQEAQDSALRYLQKTVDGLAPGTVLDLSDTIGGSNLGCDDNYTGPGPGPTEFSLFANVIGPAGVKPADLIARAGELWRSWGITVMERDGFEKPNQFGYFPDGYHIQIKAAYPPDYPPTIVNRPGESGDSTSWEGWSHVREYVEALPAGAAGAGGADGRRDQRSARFGVGSDL